MNTRKLLLEAAGHTVLTVSTPDAAKQACEQHSFDVVVIGQAMRREHKKTLFDIVRKHCSAAKVLELHEPFQKPALADADDWLPVPSAVPSDLPERVASLAKIIRRSDRAAKPHPAR